MLRTSVISRANEFTTKKWYEEVPRLTLGDTGHGYWYYKPWRVKWTRALRWRTVDSNRFVTNGIPRYGTIVKELDAEKTASASKVQPEQLRMFDHRKVHWKCAVCHTAFAKSVKGRLQHQGGCPCCRHVPPSLILGAQSLIGVPKLAQSHPQLLQHMNATEALKAKLVASSQSVVTWRCVKCEATFAASVRLIAQNDLYAGGPRCGRCLWGTCAERAASTKTDPLKTLLSA